MRSINKFSEKSSDQGIFGRVFWTFVAGNCATALAIIFFLQIGLQDRLSISERQLFLRLILLIFSVSLAVSCAILAWVLRYVFGPFHGILNWAQHVDNLDPVSVDPHAPKEVVTTSRILNDAIERLRSSEKKHQDSKIEIEKAKLSQQLAHDLRAPLSALQILVNELEGKELCHYELIRSCTTRISDIADGLVKGSRVLENDAGSHPVECTISQIISEKALQHKGSVEIEFAPQKGSESFVPLSNGELGRVISNILDNSIEAIHQQKKGTKVVVTTAIEQGSNGESVRLQIQDDGPGIPREFIRKIGRRGRTFGKINGSGIGLYNCRKILRSRGGRLRIRSDGRSGTTVEIKLPLLQKPSFSSGQDPQ